MSDICVVFIIYVSCLSLDSFSIVSDYIAMKETLFACLF